MVDELGIGDILDQATHHNPETRDLTVGEFVATVQDMMPRTMAGGHQAG